MARPLIPFLAFFLLLPGCCDDRVEIAPATKISEPPGFLAAAPGTVNVRELSGAERESAFGRCPAADCAFEIAAAISGTFEITLADAHGTFVSAHGKALDGGAPLTLGLTKETRDWLPKSTLSPSELGKIDALIPDLLDRRECSFRIVWANSLAASWEWVPITRELVCQEEQGSGSIAVSNVSPTGFRAFRANKPFPLHAWMTIPRARTGDTHGWGWNQDALEVDGKPAKDSPLPDYLLTACWKPAETR